MSNHEKFGLMLFIAGVIGNQACMIKDNPGMAVVYFVLLLVGAAIFMFLGDEE